MRPCILFVIVVLHASCSRSGKDAGLRPELRELVDAIGASRPFEPRLTGGFQHGPMPVARSEGRSLSPTFRVQMALLGIERRAQSQPTSEALAALGTASLISGDVDRAVLALSDASDEDPTRGDWLSDLAAAHLVRASAGQYADAPQALEQSERALARAPERPEAIFNNVLALEALGLAELAREVERRYSSTEQQRGWREEGARLAARLETRAQKARAVDRLEVAITSPDPLAPAALAEIVRNAAGATHRAILDKLLPAWGEAQCAGRAGDATKTLTRAMALAHALTASGGDSSLGPVLHHLRQIAAGQQQEACAALHDYGLARDLDRTDQRQQAVPHYERVRRALGDRLPLVAGWAEMHLAGTLSDLGKNQEALVLLGSAKRRAAQSPALLGNVAWSTGIVLLQQYRLLEAATVLKRGGEQFESVGDWDSAANVHSLAAYVLRQLGETADEWRQRHRALLSLPSAPFQRYLVLFSSASSALASGWPHAALRLQEAAISAATASGIPGPLCEAYAYLIPIQEALGNQQAIATATSEVKRLLPLVPDATLRSALAARIRLNEIGVLAESSPTDARVAATEAMSFFERQNRRDILPGLYLARGRLAASLGDPASSERDFEAGLEIFERTQNGATPAFSYLDRSRELFEELMFLDAVTNRNPIAALAHAERMRDLDRTARPGTSPSRSIERIRETLPPTTLAIVYATLPQRVLAWTINRGLVRIHDIAWSQSDLDRNVRRLLNAVALDDDRRVRQLSEQMFVTLVAPALSDVQEFDRVVIVPDGSLNRVPFAALRTPGGPQLVERVELVIAPAIGTFLSVSDRSKALAGTPTRALVIGNPRLPSAGTERMAHLPGASDEARAVADLYQQSTLLVEEQATKRAFLSALSQHNVIHLAGHAFANPDPALARFAFASTTDNPNDSALFASEVRELPLSSTRLVVLAACSTAVGPLSRSLGALSLARPFLAAGTPAVVGTLWDVDDDATREVMLAFHRHYSRHGDAAAALREAQLTMLHSTEPRLKRPRTWAAFVLFGAT